MDAWKADLEMCRGWLILDDSWGRSVIFTQGVGQIVMPVSSLLEVLCESHMQFLWQVP